MLRKKIIALLKMRIKLGEIITLQFEGADEEIAASATQSYLAELL